MNFLTRLKLYLFRKCAHCGKRKWDKPVQFAGGWDGMYVMHAECSEWWHARLGKTLYWSVNQALKGESAGAKWYPKSIPPSDVTKEYSHFQVYNWRHATMGHRIYEDGAWWAYRHGDETGWQLVPNDSFDYWCYVLPPTIPVDPKNLPNTVAL